MRLSITIYEYVQYLAIEFTGAMYRILCIDYYVPSVYIAPNL